MKLTTKVFKNGNSQAVRIPKAFQLRCDTVTITRTHEGLLIRDESAQQEKLARFRKLRGSCPNFPEVPANPNPDSPRDLE